MQNILDWADSALTYIGVGFAILVVLTIAYVAFKTRYKKVDTAHALVIYGRRSRKGKDGAVSREGYRILSGGGDFVKPLIEGYEVLDLRLMTMSIQLQGVYTLEGIPVNVIATAQTKIGETDELISAAAAGFLGDSQAEIEAAIKDTVAGHLRAIIGQLRAEDLYRNQKDFQDKVRDEAEADLKGMGVVFRSFTFQSIDDDDGYYRALGRPQIAAAQRDARKADADAERDAKLAEEDARRQTEARTLQVARELEEENRELELKRASVKQEVDVAQASAQAAGEMERASRGIEIADKETERTRRKLDADVREQARAERDAAEQRAEASRFEAEQRAEADAFSSRKRAETERFEAEQASEAKEAKGRGEAAATRQIADASAHEVREVGLAEAEATKARGEAEAGARLELADALARYNEAGLLLELVQVLPDVMASVAEPLARAGKTTIISTGDGTGTGAAKLAGDIAATAGTAMPLIKDLTGIDLRGIIGEGPASDDADDVGGTDGDR